MPDFETSIPDFNDIDIPTNLDDLLLQSTRQKRILGSWGFHSRLNFSKMSTEETNVWFFEQVFNFLRAFFGLVVPDHMEVVTYNATKQVKKENLNHMTFLDELMLVMKNLKEPLWVIRLHLNIVGFLRTDTELDNLLRVQIQEPASFVVWGGPDESGFQTFSITYSLFSNQKLKGQDELLWSINQPLLEKALKKWEKQTGKRIEVVKSNSRDVDLYAHGFKKPAPMQARPSLDFEPTPPKPKKQTQPEEPIEEGLPSLDDLDL